MVTPDCTITLTVPVPAGTVAVTCESSTTFTLVAGVVPKKTWSWPAAPLKFWPKMVTVEPADPLAALRLVTTGVRLTTSKSLKVRVPSPWELSYKSSSFQVWSMLLLASGE